MKAPYHYVCILLIAEKSLKVPEELRSKEYVNFEAVVPISAKNKDNVDELTAQMRHVIDKYDLIEKDEEIQQQLARAEDATKSSLTEHSGRGLV